MLRIILFNLFDVGMHCSSCCRLEMEGAHYLEGTFLQSTRPKHDHMNGQYIWQQIMMPNYKLLDDVFV
jgi:hypothetical protein